MADATAPVGTEPIEGTTTPMGTTPPASILSGTPSEPTAEQKAADEAKAAEAVKAAAQTPEQKAAAEKAEADKKAAEGEETKFKVSKDNPFKAEELKLPEGIEATPEQTTALTELVNKYGIDRRGVNDLLALQAQVAKSTSEKASAAWDKLQEEHQGKIKTDPDFGGDKLNTNLSGVKKLIDAFGDPQLRQELDTNGAGNAPYMFRFLSRIAPLLTEAQLASGVKPAGGQQGEQGMADRIYDKK